MKKRVWAALLAAAMCLGLLAGCGETATGESAVVYLTADNELNLLKSLSPDSGAIELTDRAADPDVFQENPRMLAYRYQQGYTAANPAGGMLWPTADGKSLYFLARVNDNTATLYRADLTQLKPDSDKNDTYIEKVDSSVLLYHVQLAGSGLLYAKSGDNGNRLYYHDGKESVKFTDASWEELWLTDDGKGILYLSVNQSDSEKSLYYQPLDASADREKLAANVSNAYYTNGVLLYTKYRDGKYDIYTSAPGQEGEKLVSGASGDQTVWGKTFYYTVDDSQEIPLYQFVDDPNPPANSDYDPNTPATTPPWEPYREDYRLDPYSDTLEDYERASGVSYVEWCENRLEMNADTELLFKEEMDRRHGPFYDEAAYQAAREEYDDWYRQSEAVALRRQLKSDTITVSRTQLYFFNGTESALICDDVNRIRYMDAAAQTVLYNKNQRGAVTGKLPIDEIYEVYQVREWYDEQMYSAATGSQWYYTIGSAAEGEVELEGDWEALGLLNGGKEFLVRLYENSELVSYPVENGMLGKRVSVAEDVTGCQVTKDKSAVYYYQNVSDGSGDLRRYQNGASETLASDVTWNFDANSNCIYSDGVVLALREPGSSGGTLLRFEKGESTRIADDVTYYLRLDGQRVVYLSDDNLYLYDGKERQRLSSDVALVWSPGMMTGVLL